MEPQCTSFVVLKYLKSLLLTLVPYVKDGKYKKVSIMRKTRKSCSYCNWVNRIQFIAAES